jgi:hypothetical protein
MMHRMLTQTVIMIMHDWLLLLLLRLHHLEVLGGRVEPEGGQGRGGPAPAPS